MQLTLDFSKTRPVIADGKKLAKITFTASNSFEDFLNKFAEVTNTPRSVLCHRYVLEGMQRDLATMFMAEPDLNKSLAEILSRKT